MTGDGQTQRAVFLDRDGVINQPVVREGKSYPPDRVEDFALIEGVSQACTQLKDAGFLLLVVTNQPDVRTGKQSLAEVEAMHDKLRNLLPVDDISACFHVNADNCACRKPRPGMLLQAAERHGVNLSTSYMVGDRRGDIEAGQRAGCSCFFIDYHYREAGPQGTFRTVADLHEAAEHILARANQKR